MPALRRRPSTQNAAILARSPYSASTFRKRRAAQKDTFQVTRIGCDEVWGWQREGTLAVAVVIDQSDRAVDCQPIGSRIAETTVFLPPR